MATPEQIAQRQQEQEREDAAGRIAAATPLPGATQKAFTKQPNEKFGEYTIRDFCDADYETLQALNNPLKEFLSIAYEIVGMSKDEIQQFLKEFEKKEDHLTKQLLRGQHAWNACFIFSRPPECIDELMEKVGIDDFKKSAKKEFGYKDSRFLARMMTGIVSKSFEANETKLGYESAKAGGKENGEAASSNSPPQ